MNKVLNEFLGSMSAIVIETQAQFEKLKEFMGIKNLFLSDGTPVTQLNLNVDKRIAFYRDELGMFVAYDHPANVGCNYNLKEFNQAFEEQTTLFGDNSTGIVQKPSEELIADEPIDAETKEIKNEVSLSETLNQLEIGEIQPATVTGNVVQFKDTVIRAINKYKGIVVTKDNFQELTSTRSDLNNKKAVITENRKNMKKEAMKNVDIVYDAMGEIVKAINGVVDPLNTDIKKFEDEEKKIIKQDMLNKTINPMLQMLIKNNMIDEPISKKFEFDMSWTNKGAFTSKGELTKKTKDAISAEMERLTNLFTQQENDIATIESTVKQLSLAHQLDAELKADTYIELYKKGTSMPAVQERMNQDIAIIKKTVDAAVEKKTQNIQSQQQTSQGGQHVENIQNVADTKNVTILSDEKTGEVLAKGDNQKLMALVTQTPEKQQGKMFEYTYTFSGPFGAIKTFSNILKLLSMMFKDFKYERK
nr:MAG TPA: Protein of unknown function (DUF1351) [Caudoviricetes sp.]